MNLLESDDEDQVNNKESRENRYQNTVVKVLIVAVVILLIINGILLINFISEEFSKPPDVDFSVVYLPNGRSDSFLSIQVLIVNNEDRSHDCEFRIEYDYYPEVTLSVYDDFTDNEEFELEDRTSKMYHFNYMKYGSEYFHLDIFFHVDGELVQTVEEIIEL